MIVFITHGDGPRGAERAVCNLLTDAPPSSWLSVISLGKAFDVNGARLREHQVQGKAEAVSATMAEIARGQQFGQAVTLCYVNGHMAVPFAAFAWARLRCLFGRPRTRLILWEHCVPHTHYERRGGLGRRVIRALYVGMLRMADAVVAPSSVIGADLDRYFAGISTTVEQIDNPIVLAPATTLALQVNWPAGTSLRTVFVGALSPEKQPHLALDWLTANRGLGAHLLLCGDGPMRGELQARIDAQGLPATIAGHVDNLRAYYQQADLLICTSRYETFSNVMTEAAMCGCWVLSTDWPGVDSVYGAHPQVRIHRGEGAPVFDLPTHGSRPLPGKRLVNFDAAAYLQQLEGRT